MKAHSPRAAWYRKRATRGHSPVLIGLLLVITTGWSVGSCVVRADRAAGFERFALQMLTGLGITAIVAMLLGSVSLSLAVVGIGLLLVVSALWQVRILQNALGNSPRPKREPMTFFERLCLAGIGGVGVLTFIAALAPVTSWDAGVAHLALPSDYSRIGRIQLLDGNVYSAYPQALHSLFTIIFYVSGERGVTLFCWCFGWIGCAAIYALGRRLEGRMAGILAAAFLATSPIFILQAATVAIDIPFAAVVLGMLLCVMRWHKERTTHWLIVAGILGGFGCGIRHPGYIAVVMCALAIGIGERRSKDALTLAIVSACFAAPWFVRSIVLVGNPVYPLLESVFPQDVFAIHQITSWGEHETIRGASLPGFLTFPFDMVMHPRRYDGWSANPGGWIWILGIPGVILGGRVARGLALFSLIGVSCFYMVQRLARYATAFFVPMHAVAGLAGAKLGRANKPLQGLIIAGIAYGLVLTAASMYFKVPAALGLESRDDYLARRVDRYRAFQWINENVPVDSRILTIDLRTYYLNRLTFQNTNDLYMLKSMSLDEKVVWFAEREIEYIVLPEDIVRSSPDVKATGLSEEFALWESSPDYFETVETLRIPRARGEGEERVVILRVLPPKAEAAP